MPSLSADHEQYYNFPVLAIDSFAPDLVDGAVAPLTMRLHNSALAGTYSLTLASPLGPLTGMNVSQMRAVFDEASAMDFTFAYTNLNDGPFGRSMCVEITICRAIAGFIFAHRVRWEVLGHCSFTASGAALYTLRENSYAGTLLSPLRPHSRRR